MGTKNLVWWKWLLLLVAGFAIVFMVILSLDHRRHAGRYFFSRNSRHQSVRPQSAHLGLRAVQV